MSQDLDRGELLETLALAKQTIQRYSELPRCLPLPPSLLSRLERAIDQLSGLPPRPPRVKPVEAAPVAIQATPPASSKESWMLPPREPQKSRRWFMTGSAVPERIAKIEAYLAEHGTATIGELAVFLHLGEMKVRYALDAGPFLCDDGHPARYRLRHAPAVA
jgi:hypothetical protein